MNKINNIYKKLINLNLAIFYIFSFIFIYVLQPKIANAAASVTITSPSSNQKITSDSTLIKGTASINSLVTVLVDGLTLGQALADGSGNWSIEANGLSSGSHTITATVRTTPSNLDFIAFDQTLNRFDSQSFAVNQDAPFNPSGITSTNPYQVTSINSPTDPNISYLMDVFYIGGGETIPGKYDQNNPADPDPIANYPASANAQSGVFVKRRN